MDKRQIDALLSQFYDFKLSLADYFDQKYSGFVVLSLHL